MIVDRIWLGDSVEKGFLTYLKEYAKNWRDRKTRTQQTGIVESIMIENMAYGQLL